MLNIKNKAEFTLILVSGIMIGLMLVNLDKLVSIFFMLPFIIIFYHLANFFLGKEKGDELFKAFLMGSGNVTDDERREKGEIYECYFRNEWNNTLF